MSLGPFILRALVGALFIGHGGQKLFGWFGGPGPVAAGRYFERGFGYRDGEQMARLAGATELGAGALLVFGLLTPFAAAAIVGTMLNAAVAAHRDNGLWNSQGGYEYPLVLGTIATTLAFTGPGAFSLDRAFGLDLAGPAWGFTALLLGLAAGGATLAMRNEDAFDVTSEQVREQRERELEHSTA